jgi:hypothetical protein
VKKSSQMPKKAKLIEGTAGELHWSHAAPLGIPKPALAR